MKNVDLWRPSKFVVSKGQLEISQTLDVSSKRMASYIAQFYNKNIPLYCRGSLLDMGCGQVPLYEFYKDYVNKVYCIDWNNSPHKLSFIDEYCNLNGQLSFENDYFDTIILSDVIEHLEEPLLTLSEIYRTLKPSGNLIMNFPFLYGLHEVPYDFGRYTNHRIRSWADKLGYIVTVEEDFGGYLDQIEHSFLRMIKKRKTIFGKSLANSIYYSFSMMQGNIIFKKINNSGGTHPYMYGFVLTKS